MPRDFLMDEMIKVNQKSELPGIPRDFLNEDHTKKEGLGTALFLSPFRIGKDAVVGAWNTAQKIPDYYNQAQTEIPGLLNHILSMDTPSILGAGIQNSGIPKQALAGMFEAANSLRQLPKGIAQYGEERLNLLPKGSAEMMEMLLPGDASQAINNLFGSPQEPGEALARGLTRNVPQLAGGAKLASTFNPMQLTSKNIAKSIVEAERKNKDLYSKRYDDLFKQSPEKIKVDPIKIDVERIKEYAPDKFTESLDRFLENPTTENAHWAQSDLKKYNQKNRKRDSIPQSEKQSLRAAKSAEEYIREQMFKDSPKLKKEYDVLTAGYRKDVIPYTSNPKIQAYKAGELLPKELIPSLKSGKFMATRGNFHPQLIWQDRLKNALMAAGIGGGLWAGAEKGYDYFNSN